MRIVALGSALTAGLMTGMLCGGCPAGDDQGAQDWPADGQPTVVLSAEQIAGPGGVLIYQGQEITGSVTVPENAILGAYQDGQIYLYHPALGSEELSEYNSRRAVGYFMAGLSTPSKAPALMMRDPLAIGAAIKMKTGVAVRRDTVTKCRVENLSARFVALKTVFDGSKNKHAFLPAAELGFPTSVLDLLDQATVGIFSSSSIRTIDTPELAIESYGSVARAVPLLMLPGAEDRYRDTYRGMAKAMVYDLDLYSRVNSLDIAYTAYEGIKNIGRVVSPFECIDLVIPEVMIGGAETVTIGLLESDDMVMRKVALDYIKNLINSLVGAIVELAAGEFTNPVGLTAMAVNEFTDIVGLAKWIADVAVAGTIDCVSYAPFDRLELTRPILPDLETTTQYVGPGEIFQLVTLPAVRAAGANLRVACRWVPETTTDCDPDQVPPLDVYFYAGEFPVNKRVTEGDANSGFWVYETTTFGDDMLHGEFVQFRIQVSRLGELDVFTLPELTVPEGVLPPCEGSFQVDARIEYQMAE
jgi:hypothetical protein